MKLRIVVLPGDDIGPEVTRHAVAVLQTVSDVSPAVAAAAAVAGHFVDVCRSKYRE